MSFGAANRCLHWAAKAFGSVWSHLQASGSMGAGPTFLTDKSCCKRVNWKHLGQLEASERIWKRSLNSLEASGSIWTPLKTSGSVWRHPEGSGRSL